MRYFRILLFITIGLLYCHQGFSYDFEVDGLCYNKLTNNTVEVTYKEKNGNSYSGKLNIPEKISYNGVVYSVTSIGTYAFYRCGGLTGSLTIPNSVISIGNYAFFECGELTGSLTIPNSVTSIGKYAFCRCSGLTGSLTISNSIKSIEEAVFFGCSRLTGSLTIPNSVTSIGTYAFYRCSGLTGSLTIPNSVTSIGTQTFEDCSGLSGSLTIPNSVLSIGSSAFAGCSGLTGSLTIPNSVTSIGSRAFSGCKGFTGSLTIPNSVTSIGTQTFFGCSGLTGSLIIPNSVTSIEEDAFHDCSGLTGSLIIPNSVISIEEEVFAGCSGLTGSLIIPNSVTSIGSRAFSGCKGFTGSLTISNSVTSIENGAFSGCSGLSGSLTIPNSVTSIGSSAFSGCSGLSGSLTIPNSVTSIGSSAFSGCSGLSGSLIIPNSVTSIGDNAFLTCKGFSDTLTIPSSVISIGDFAFYGCHDIKIVKSEIETPFAIDNKVFYSYTKHQTLQVPNGTKNKYLEFTGWITYFDRVIEEGESTTTYILSITASGNGHVLYDNAIIKEKTQEFVVDKGAVATVRFVPNAGYRIASVKLNGTDVTSSVANNEYTINNISANTTLIVTFEAIPPTTYTFSITATGNGTATYNSTAVRGKTQSFTVNEGTSATITFVPDAGYRIASVKLNGTDVTASVANNMYTISSITANTTLAVTFEAIPPTTYTFNITASGNGYVAYDGNSIRGKTSSFSLEEGSNAVLKFSADNGNRLKSVKVNGQDVTSTIVNNQYTINNITADINVEVVFEAIPTYSLNIVASGNGNAVYNGMTIRNQSKNLTIQEGSSAIISFTPDANYRIKSVKVNNADVTSQVTNGQITISNIVQDTNVEVSFEEIPPTTYSLTITAIGNGAITYDGNSIRGGSSTFTVVEGSYVTVQITADDGYRLKRVTYNGNDVTASAVSGRFTTDKITANSTLVVEFEAIPTFSLTIKSSAFGSVKYGNAVITNQTEAFTVREGTEAVMTFIPDGNGRLQRITLNGSDITNELVNGQYTISDIRADQSVEAEYVEDITKVTDAGVAYTVTSYDEGTVVVAAGNYGQVLTVPASFTAKGKTWTVTGIDSDALIDAIELAAVIWEPEVPFTAQVSNPNLLLYVKRNQYAQSNVQNVVVGDENEGEALMADNIVLTEAESGNNFYCPKAFEAKRISYEHNYSMISGYKDCQGWETLVLPFDVTMAINTKGTELVPYSTWTYGSNLRPFWLYQMTNQGWQTANGIKANVPYIISMPNNEMYNSSYNLTGNIQFIGTNVEVKASDNLTTVQYGNKRLVANYQNQAASSDIYALNVSNDWHQNTATEKEGSTFIRSLRNVHPFEAYMTVEGSNAPWAIPIFEGGTTNLTPIPSPKDEGRYEWYDLQGRKLQGEPTKNGLYINKGKKIRK